MDINLSLGGIQAALNSSLDVRDFVHDDGSGSNNVVSSMALVPPRLIDVASGWLASYTSTKNPPTSRSLSAA